MKRIRATACGNKVRVSQHAVGAVPQMAMGVPVRMETPMRSKLFHRAPCRTETSSTRGSCFGMRKIQTEAMGMHTRATNQNTQCHDANCTKIAPMMSPSTAKRRRMLASGTTHGRHADASLTIPNGTTTAEHANGARLLRRLRKDVDEECQRGRDGHGSGCRSWYCQCRTYSNVAEIALTYAAERTEDDERDLACHEAGTDREHTERGNAADERELCEDGESVRSRLNFELLEHTRVVHVADAPALQWSHR